MQLQQITQTRNTHTHTVVCFGNKFQRALWLFSPPGRPVNGEARGRSVLQCFGSFVFFKILRVGRCGGLCFTVFLSVFS